MLSVTEAQKMINELKNHEISLGRDPKTWYTYENHVYGVAQIAKMIAGKLKTMAPDRLYVMGLLHDICRTEDDRYQRFHGVLGYEKLIRSDPDAARICLIHSFPWDELPPYCKCAALFYNQEKDYQFVADFINNHPPKDEDYLIQLCDNLADKDGFTTIEKRCEDVIRRHGTLYVEDGLVKLNNIKLYFDKKVGFDIYDLFNSGV